VSQNRHQPDGSGFAAALLAVRQPKLLQ
jgi:hypothetical protein